MVNGSQIRVYTAYRIYCHRLYGQFSNGQKWVFYLRLIRYMVNRLSGQFWLDKTLDHISDMQCTNVFYLGYYPLKISQSYYVALFYVLNNILWYYLFESVITSQLWCPTHLVACRFVLVTRAHQKPPLPRLNGAGSLEDNTIITVFDWEPSNG